MAYFLYNLAMKKHQRPRWFAAKEYGWGWVPCTWQGWVSTLIFSLGYVFILISFMGWLGAATSAHMVDYRGLSLGLLEFLTAIALLTYGMIRFCTRFGDAPSWRWGKK